jgi:hypothetical protein
MNWRAGIVIDFIELRNGLLGLGRLKCMWGFIQIYNSGQYI